ncbi:flavodoxin domain-containing protein [Chloroflexota bacterium]
MKVLIAYFSLSGTTEKMAEYIAEGLRFSGQQVVVKKISDIKSANDLVDYDGYIFGSPTYHRDIAEPMKTFLFLAKKANLASKLAGAFGSYTHSGDAPAIIFDTIQYVYKMEPFELGALNLKEAQLEETGKGEPSHRQYIAGEVHGEAGEGMRACQDYGKVFGQKLGS